MRVLAAYLHFPFCVRKCAYCDFNSRVGDASERSAYVMALQADLARAATRLPAGAPWTVASVYLGGGTPTLYSPQNLAGILDCLRSALPVAADAEITCEANPGTVTVESLRQLHDAGVTRLSLGVQSLDDRELRLLGRVHSAEAARRAVADAREAGFENLSLDLIRGLPGQRLRDWDATLAGTIALAPQHISVYGLTLEEGTALRNQVDAGLLPSPGGSGNPHWVSWTAARLAAAGYARYEVSNYAEPGHECRHNLVYWHNQEYLGVGAGAWSYLNGERSRSIADVARYTAAALAGDDTLQECERVDPARALGETVMLGLRLVEGIAVADLDQRFGVDFMATHAERVARLVGGGLAEFTGGRLRLTPAGLLVQSAVAAGFLPD